MSSYGYKVGDSQVEKKKMKKMQSRMKMQNQLENLSNKVNKVQDVNKKLVKCIKAKEETYIRIEFANNILKTRIMALEDRL
ncbi:hypothetical protein CR513_62531, partial [Mucuna pruriens]